MPTPRRLRAAWFCVLAAPAATIVTTATIAVLYLTAPNHARAEPHPNDPRAEFWVIGPNEGESAGGHAAIRIDDWVYHVEHRGDGLIADRRTRRSAFERAYRGRWNRRIEAIPLDLDPEQTLALEARLRRRASKRAHALTKLDALEQEVAWLRQVETDGFLRIEVPGLGLFSDPPPGGCPLEGPSLRRSLEARQGRSALDAQRQAARTAVYEARRGAVRPRRGALHQRRTTADPDLELAASDRVTDPARPRTPTDRRATGPLGSHRRLMHATQIALALDVIADCAPLARHRRATTETHGSDSSTAPSTPGAAELAGWHAMRSEVEKQIADLLASTRADRGLPLLLAAARWQALSESIDSGELVWLRPYQENSPPPRSQHHARTAGSQDLRRDPDDSSEKGERRRGPRASLPEGWAEVVRAQAEHDLEEARSHFGTGNHPLEARFAALERAGHTYEHVRDGTLHRGPSSDRLSPSLALLYAEQSRVIGWPEGGSIEAVAQRRRALQARVASERASLLPTLGYQLLTQNCVTELLDELEVEFRHETHSDWVRIGRGEFIPAVAGRYLESAMGGGGRRTMPSAHEQIRRRLRHTGASPAWREYTPLASRAYVPHPADSAFLLFTADAPVWTRPLIGGANLGFAALSGALGVLQAPFDRGQRLQRSLRGLVMSVPELVFASVRKGTYPIDPPTSVLDPHPEKTPSENGDVLAIQRR